MKRLFGLLFVFVVFFSFSHGFSFAQTPPAETKASLGAKADALFNNFIIELQAEQANPKGLVPALSGATDAQVAAYVQGSKDLVVIVNNAKTNFATVYNTPSASPNIYANLTSSLMAVKSKINEQEKTTPSVQKVPMLRAKVTILSKRIDDLSQEKQRELINGGQADQAVATQKAVPADVVTKTDSLKSPESCTIWNWSLRACINDAIVWFIKSLWLNVAGFLLWLTTEMFTYVMKIGVLEFKRWAPDALYPIWTLIRQIVSLAIVFIGLYLGFLYIVGTEMGKAKFSKYVPWVVMFALFVNFSYPLARFAVDLSNVVSLSVYTAAFGNEAFNSKSAFGPGAIVMDRLGLTGLVINATKEERAGVDLIDQVNSVPGALLTVIFVLYAAYVFFMATALIAIRTAALVFLTVASPFLFVDSVLPFLGDKAQQIRKVFVEQLAVGPIFLILLTLTLRFISIFSESGILGSANAATSGTSKDVAVFFNIFMMLVMLHLTLKITKTVSGTIGQMATDAMGKVGGFAMGAATGGAGLLARNSIGKLAMKARDSKWVTNNQDSFLGRRMYDMSNSLSKSSFDLRNSSVIAGGMQKAGLGMGKGRTAGYEEAMEARRKTILERGSRIKTRYERDVYEDEKDENGKVVLEDVTLPDGKTVIKKPRQKLVHRKGDLDKEGESALNRYVQEGGGSMFMTAEQRALARDALGTKADEETKKRIDEAKSKSEQDVQTYSSIKKDPLNRDGMGITEEERKDKFRVMLRHELDDLKKVDPGLQGQQAQSLIQTLQKIDDKRSAELVEKYNKTNDPAEKQRVMYDIKSELAAIQTRDGDLESHEAQALLGTLQSIEDINKKAQQALEEQAQKFVNRYNKIEGNPEEVRAARLRMVNNLEDENLRREVEKLGVTMEKKTGSTSRLVNQDGVAFSDADINRSTAPDLDLTYNEWSSRDTPPSMRGTATPSRDRADIDAERVRKQRDAFVRAQAELGPDTPIDVSASYNPKTDDIAKAMKNIIRGMRQGPGDSSPVSSGATANPRSPSPSTGQASRSPSSNSGVSAAAVASALTPEMQSALGEIAKMRNVKSEKQINLEKQLADAGAAVSQNRDNADRFGGYGDYSSSRNGSYSAGVRAGSAAASSGSNEKELGAMSSNSRNQAFIDKLKADLRAATAEQNKINQETIDKFRAGLKKSSTEAETA